MGYLRMPPDGYDKLLEKDPKLIQQDLRDFILYLKKDHSSATVSIMWLLPGWKVVKTEWSFRARRVA